MRLQSCSPIVTFCTFCQDTADSLYKGGRLDAITTDFSKAFNSVHDWLLTKIVALGMDSRVVIWVKELHLSHLQRVRAGGQSSEEVRLMSGILPGTVLGPLLLLAYINNSGETLRQVLEFRR